MARAALFDCYVAIDWSARSVPARGVDSIWVAALDAATGGSVELSNPATRHAADVEVLGLLDRWTDRRVLVGIDVALGYPAGSPALFGAAPHHGGPWRAIWALLAAALVDDPRNRNNRFEVAGALNRVAGDGAGPFWGCPAGRAVPGLAPTKPASFPLPELRATERWLRELGRSPMSVWQLLGAGSVGGQSLTAIPRLHRWIDELGGRVSVWPFDHGAVPPVVGGGSVVVAEVWPTMFDPVVPAGTVRDAAQVECVARRLAAADADGSLAAWFEPSLTAEQHGLVREEGWVLGPGAAALLR